MKKTQNLRRTVPIFLSFLVMGFGDVSGPLTSQLQNDFNLSNFQASLTTFAGFIMFGLLSIPMGLIQDRQGRVRILGFGLVASLIGLILPAISHFSSFLQILAGILLLGAGATALQVSGNPIMRDVSPKGKYARNLSFGQFVKAIGSLSGALIPLIAIRLWGLDWKILFPIYSGVVFLVIVSMLVSGISNTKRTISDAATFKSCFSLLGNPMVGSMVLGVFLYVGAEVSMSARLPSYLELRFGMDIKEMGLLGTLFFLIFLMIGRLVGGIILNKVNPNTFLSFSSLISVLGFVVLYIATSAVVGYIAIFFIGIGFANLFSLIFALTIDKFPERSNEISGLLVTAIIGGAILPLLFGAIADGFGLMIGFLLPLFAVLYIYFISLKVRDWTHEIDK